MKPTGEKGREQRKDGAVKHDPRLSEEGVRWKSGNMSQKAKQSQAG